MQPTNGARRAQAARSPHPLTVPGHAAQSRRPRTGLFALVAALSLALCSVPAAARETDESLGLPTIGDPASTVMSPSQERRLGETLLRQVRANLNVSEDPELNAYVRSLGTQIAGAGLDRHLDFNFLVIEDHTINAFAAPGGLIALNSGLLTAAQSESEVAGVLAHELAHLEQRHLARTYANAQTINWRTALAVLGAVLAGAYNPQVGSAAIASTLAAGAQSQLAFSRSNEREADRVGIALLAQAGFDPHGMPAFLERLHDYTQLNTGPVPEFLSTHPVTLTRISDTRSRAAQYDGQFTRDSQRFQFARARALVLTSSPKSLIERYEQALQSGQGEQPVDRYTYALALERAGQPRKAIDVLADIDAQGESEMPVKLALAQARIAARDTGEAIEQLQELHGLYPDQEPIIHYLADAYIHNGDPAKALALLDRPTRAAGHSPSLDQLKAKAAARAERPWLSHEALADYYVAYGHFGAAIEQLDLALNASGSQAIAESRLRTKRERLIQLEADSPIEGG